MSAFARKVQAEQDSAARIRARNPKSPEGLNWWLHSNAPPVNAKLIEIDAELKRMFGDEARVKFHAMTPAPYVGQFGGYVPAGVYIDLTMTLNGGKTGVGRSIFLEVRDNKLIAPRFGWVFDADAPDSLESRQFPDQIESGMANLLRDVARPAKRH